MDIGTFNNSGTIKWFTDQPYSQFWQATLRAYYLGKVRKADSQALIIYERQAVLNLILYLDVYRTLMWLTMGTGRWTTRQTTTQPRHILVPQTASSSCQLSCTKPWWTTFFTTRQASKLTSRCSPPVTSLATPASSWCLATPGSRSLLLSTWWILATLSSSEQAEFTALSRLSRKLQTSWFSERLSCRTTMLSLMWTKTLLGSPMSIVMPRS